MGAAIVAEIAGSVRIIHGLALLRGARLGPYDVTVQIGAVRDLLALKPDFGATARREFDKWQQPELVEHLIDGLRKGALDVSG